MSLDTIWLVTGMPGLCGFQTGGQAGRVVFTQEQDLGYLTLPRARKQGRGRLCLLRCDCLAGLALSPEIRSAWEALDWSTPGTRLALGKKPTKWVMPSPPLSLPDQWLGRDKEPRITRDTAAGCAREARTQMAQIKAPRCPDALYSDSSP